MLTIEKFISNLKRTTSGCLIYKRGCTVSIWYKGKITSIIRVLFEYYGKEYKGKVIRTCKNGRCWNLDHILSPSREELFWSRVDMKEEDKCWEWRGTAGTTEYGQTSWLGKDMATHRIAWMLTFGEIPDGLLVCHHCDNPPCCNPKHLFIGTNQDNIDDRERKNRNWMPHSRGEEHGHHKLTEKDVKEIRDLYSTGKYSYLKLAKLYPVSWGAIRQVIKRQNWGWLE